MATTISRPVHFQIDDPKRVKAYLAAHPDVAESLDAAREVLPRYFEDPYAWVDVYEEPEDIDAPPKPRVAIRTSPNLAETRERLYRFHREWWRYQPSHLIYLLEFGIE